MTQKKTYRMGQVNRLLQEEIANLLLTEMEDERLRSLTITEVRTAKDLSHALVFVTTHGDENRDNCMEAANHSAGILRKLLYGRLHLKRVPNLEFRYDESLDRAERIFQTLRRIEEDREEEPLDS